MQYDDYKFDRSVYQRPACRHQCGRSRLWKKACWQGPQSNGSCGGTHECKPERSSGGYLCTRPARAGGPCAQGPDELGHCCNVHPPCKPRLSLRHWRGRFVILALLAVVGAIALFSSSLLPGDDKTLMGAGPFEGPIMMPGPVSDRHRTFTGEERCGSCHQSHGDDPLEWFLSAFRPQQLSRGCLNCHRFEGPALAPHQRAETDKPLSNIQCATCHTEHKGNAGQLTEVTNQTCANCHEKAFSDFESGHPEFDEQYPHFKPQTLYFNHLKHVNEYFTEDKWLDKPNRDREFGERAAKDCTVCHAVDGADRAVKPKSYAVMCANCHDQQILDRQLIAMTVEEVSPVLMGLSDANTNAETANKDPDDMVSELLQRMSEEGLAPLTEMSGDTAMTLWAGMNALEIQKAAIGWLEEEDYEALMEEQQRSAGWHVGETEDGDQAVFYRSSGHGDPVLKHWIETYVGQKIMGDESADEALETLLDLKDGPGACAKCHIGGLRAAIKTENHSIKWAYGQQEINEYTHYSHAPHIDLMGDKAGCDSCHKFATGSSFKAYFEADLSETAMWASAFKSIDKQTCQTCHAEGRISANCLTCHAYHKGQDFRLGFMDTTPVTEVDNK